MLLCLRNRGHHSSVYRRIFGMKLTCTVRSIEMVNRPILEQSFYFFLFKPLSFYRISMQVLDL